VPIYEYTCRECGCTFEKLQPSLRSPVAPCPQCGKSAEKIMSASAGYVMKGASQGEGRKWPGENGPCCGQDAGCDNPKRCCTKG